MSSHSSLSFQNVLPPSYPGFELLGPSDSAFYSGVIYESQVVPHSWKILTLDSRSLPHITPAQFLNIPMGGPGLPEPSPPPLLSSPPLPSRYHLPISTSSTTPSTSTPRSHLACPSHPHGHCPAPLTSALGFPFSRPSVASVFTLLHLGTELSPEIPTTDRPTDLGVRRPLSPTWISHLLCPLPASRTLPAARMCCAPSPGSGAPSMLGPDPHQPQPCLLAG